MGIILDLYKEGTICETPYRNIYEVLAKDTLNITSNLSSYKNKVMLIVNLNSSTNLNNKDDNQRIDIINKLKEEYSNELEVLVFPTNTIDHSQFTKDEICDNITKLDLNKEIKVFNKVSIFGKDTCEVYKFLSRRSKLFKVREGKASKINNNLSIFLVSKAGEVDKLLDTEISYDSIREDITNLIKQKQTTDLQIRTDFISLGKFI